MNILQKLTASALLGTGILGGGVYVGNQLNNLKQENAGLIRQANFTNTNFAEYKRESATQKDEANKLLHQMEDKLNHLQAKVESQVTFDQLPGIVARNQQNTLMTKGVGGSWTSSLLRIDDRLFVLSCAHPFKNADHFLSNSLSFEAFDKSYKFQMKPVPFKDGSIGLFGHDIELDISIFPLTEDVIAKLPDRGSYLGAELEDISKMPKYGSYVYTLANSAPLSHSLHMGPVVHPDRRTYVYDGWICKNNIEHFPVDYGNSGAPLFNVSKDGKQVGVISWGPSTGGVKGGPPRSFSVIGAVLKAALANDLGLPVLTEEDRGLIALENLSMPTPFNTTPLGNIIPRKPGKLQNAHTINTLKHVPVLSLDPFCQASSTVVANYSRELAEKELGRIKDAVTLATSPRKSKN